MTTNPELAPDMPELLPCPFCGSKAEDGYELEGSQDSTGVDYIFCTGCYAKTDKFMSNKTSSQQAALAWNQRADLAPQAGSVDVERLKRKVPKMPSGRLARACELNAINNAKVWNSCIDHLASRNLLNPGPQGSVDVKAVIDAVTSFYTRKEDRNFAAQVARNTLDNLLSGAPVGGDRPAIPGLQEAIAVLREEISVMENIITRNLEGNNKNTRRKLEQWKALYEAARQSGVPDGWREIDDGAKTGEHFVLTDARLKDVYVVAAYDKDEKFPWSTLDGQYHENAFTHYIPRAMTQTEQGKQG